MGQPSDSVRLLTPEFANRLYALVKREQARLVVEVGLAHGATALSIATALISTRAGRLISIVRTNLGLEGCRPWQPPAFRIGPSAGSVEEPDYLALPEFLTNG